MNKTYNPFILFALFFVTYIIFWLIVEPSSLRPERFENIVGILDGLALFVLPPITAALTFKRKIGAAILTPVIFVIAASVIQMLLPINSEEKGYVLYVIPWLLMWDFFAMVIAAILRLIVDKMRPVSEV